MKRTVFVLALAVLFAINLPAAEVIPPKPDRYLNDYAGVVSKDVALRFNEQLAQFERDTSNQIVVAVWQTMPSQSSIEDFTQRTFQAWGIGQKGRNNGVVLFVFIEDRRMRIQPGYGLEGALPDITCDQIIRNDIAPHFRTGNYEAGLAAGIDSIGKAIRGEYTGTGRTSAERSSNGSPVPFLIFLFIFIVMFVIMWRRVRRAGYRYSRLGGPYIGGWSSGSGGGGWSSGGDGFSGFSGGGGSSGGGGASGSW